MNSKEYLPLPMLVGSALKCLAESQNESELQFLLPLGYGADADGQYARAVRTILDRCGHIRAGIVSPFLEELPEKADDVELLFRALLTADILYAAPAELRERLAPTEIPDMESLIALAKRVSQETERDEFIAAVGTPLCVTSLDEGILDELENEGRCIRRMPLGELMWFLWKDNGKGEKALDNLKKEMEEVSSALGAASSFAADSDALIAAADKILPDFAGAFGRYRYVKILQMGKKAKAVLALAPRYENTAMVLQLSHITDNCTAPVFDLSLDGDWDEIGWAKLRSFLYYC